MKNMQITISHGREKFSLIDGLKEHINLKSSKKVEVKK